MHVLEAVDSKDGAITLLAPNSPYRPCAVRLGEARSGDYDMLVPGTDPPSVLTVLASVGDEVALGGALLSSWRYGADVVDLTTLAMMLELGTAPSPVGASMTTMRSG